jgi:hypothetical protein
MTNSTHALWPMIGIYLRTVRWIYEEDAVSVVFLSAIADYQEELRAAGDNRAAHTVVRCRWSLALVSLLVTTAFVSTRSLRVDRVELAKTVACGWLFVALYAMPFGGPWSCFREFMIAAGGGGSMLAFAMLIRNQQQSPVTGLLGQSVGWDGAIASPIVPVAPVGVRDGAVA